MLGIRLPSASIGGWQHLHRIHLPKHDYGAVIQDLYGYTIGFNEWFMLWFGAFCGPLDDCWLLIWSLSA